MAPLPRILEESLSIETVNQFPEPDPSLFAHAIIGARYTPIHFLLLMIFIQYPLYAFLAYRGTLKKWTFEKYITSKGADYTVGTPSPQVPSHITDKSKPLEEEKFNQDYLEFIDLETALTTIPPSKPSDFQRLEITEEMFRSNSSNSVGQRYGLGHIKPNFVYHAVD